MIFESMALICEKIEVSYLLFMAMQGYALCTVLHKFSKINIQTIKHETAK